MRNHNLLICGCFKAPLIRTSNWSVTSELIILPFIIILHMRILLYLTGQRLANYSPLIQIFYSTKKSPNFKHTHSSCLASSSECFFFLSLGPTLQKFWFAVYRPTPYFTPLPKHFCGHYFGHFFFAPIYSHFQLKKCIFLLGSKNKIVPIYWPRSTHNKPRYF